MQRGQKHEIEFFKLYDRTSVDRAVDRYAQGLDQSTERSTSVVQGRTTHLGRSIARSLTFSVSPARTDIARGRTTHLGRSIVRSPTFSISPARTEGIERSTTHLGRLTRRSTDSQVRMNYGPDLELFWGFLLFSINRDLNSFLGLRISGESS